jgi:uncharacterized protein
MKTRVTYFELGVRLGPTAYGLGVFAMREFSAHETIGPVEGEIFLDGKHESEYCMELGEIGCIEPDAPFRFLNHSCQPNCCLTEFEVEHDDGSSDPELWLAIESDIAPGEQMTIDYAWPAKHAIPCRCGSLACRHWIVAPEQLTQLG